MDKRELIAARVAALEKALRPYAELGEDLTERLCHSGICSAEQCVRCARVLANRALLAPPAESEVR